MTKKEHDEIQRLRERLEETEETLRAIRGGEVDAIVVPGQKGEQVFTLRDAEHAYRALVESMNEGAATLSRGGSVLYANSRLAEILGITLDKLLGVPLEEFVPAAALPAYRALMDQSRASAGRAELSLRTAAGSEVPVYISGRALEADSALGICLVVTDLTELKRTQEYLAKTERELNDARRLSDIGALAATVAHELRNPLAAISVSAKLLQLKGGVEAGREQISMINKKVSESDQIINNLLFYSRLRPPILTPVNLHQIIRESLSLAEKRYPQRATVVTDMEVLQRLEIRADPLQMKELFTNLINNAYEAIAGENGHIQVAADRPEPGCVQIGISDNGVGMPDEQAKKVLEPFFTTKSKGTGLGLTVSNQIVQLHHGCLSLASREGGGTRVQVTLPTAANA